MSIKPIRSESDYDSALAEIAQLMDAKGGSAAGDRLDVLVTLVESYEDKHWRIDPPDPIDAIKLRLRERRSNRRDVEALLGGKARAAEILNRRRPLTIGMIRRLHQQLGIPAESLIQPTTVSKGRRTVGRDAA